MFKPDKRLQKKYDFYNVKFFHGELPRADVGWNDELPEIYHGLTTSFHSELGNLLHFNVSLHPQLKATCKAQVWLTLLHEMTHVKLYPIMNHGIRFNEEMTRLAIAGAFKDIW